MNLNPFKTEKQFHVPSGVMVIFGGTGDLAKRKLIPGLYDLLVDGLLPVNFFMIGLARQEIDQAYYQKFVEDSVDSHSRYGAGEGLSEFSENSQYIQGSFDEDRSYQDLSKRLDELDKIAGTKLQRVFYFATAPRFFSLIASQLSKFGLLSDQARARVVVEKPFGHNHVSAKELNRSLLKVLAENQIYRIDHYLGKETVQNILVFRFANGIFEPLWNHKYIDHIEITVAESLGVGRRAGYFDNSGMVRDVLQNHLLQLLSLVALEPPINFEADAIRNEKLKVLQALNRIKPEEVENYAVRARYQSGFIAGKEVPGYLVEPGVVRDSVTETYAALKFTIDNWRWAGVPFFVRTGKRLAKKVTDISIFFKNVPYRVFRDENISIIHPNVLSFQIQPDEGISLKVGTKPPGPAVRIQPVKMDFNYGSVFGGDPPRAYERLLLDSLRGDATLFTRSDEIEEAWQVVDPIIERWSDKKSKLPVFGYESGSWGPKAAELLIKREHGTDWRRL